MTRQQQAQQLGMAVSHRIASASRPVPPHGVRPVAELSHWLGPRMPARRANQEPAVSAFPQAQSSEALELAQQREAHRPQSFETDRKPRSKQDFLKFFDEWMNEPDEMGEEWWARFDEDLKAHRLHFSERELP